MVEGLWTCSMWSFKGAILKLLGGVRPTKVVDKNCRLSSAGVALLASGQRQCLPTAQRLIYCCSPCLRLSSSLYSSCSLTSTSDSMARYLRPMIPSLILRPKV